MGFTPEMKFDLTSEKQYDVIHHINNKQKSHTHLNRCEKST